MSEIERTLQDAAARLRASAPTASATEAHRLSLGDARPAAAVGRRSRRWVVVPAIGLAAACIVGLVLVTRPDDSEVTPVDTSAPSSTPDSALPTSPDSTATTPVTAPTSSAPSTPPTQAPTTTTTPPTTTTIPTAAVWTPSEFSSGYFTGCCGAPGTGTPSPALTTDPEPLENGVYALTIDGWSATDPNRLVVTVRDIVACADSADAECQNPPDGGFPADAVGLGSQSRTLTIDLSGNVAVEVSGDDVEAMEAGGQLANAAKMTDGSGLADLLTALTSAYDQAIAAPLANGVTPDEIVAELQVEQSRGFISAMEYTTGLLYFMHDSAPPILFQAISDQAQPLALSGIAAIQAVALTVDDGQLTLELYAGFRS